MYAHKLIYSVVHSASLVDAAGTWQCSVAPARDGPLGWEGLLLRFDDAAPYLRED